MHKSMLEKTKDLIMHYTMAMTKPGDDKPHQPPQTIHKAAQSPLSMALLKSERPASTVMLNSSRAPIMKRA